LDFDGRPDIMAYVQNHLQAYRVWRHFAFNPPGSCPLRDGQTRRYLGFGRLQFRQLCEAAHLVGPGFDRTGSYDTPCWSDRAAAELFFASLTTRQGEDSQGLHSALDFPRYLRLLVLPVGDLLINSPNYTGPRDALEAFVSRLLCCASRGFGFGLDGDSEGTALGSSTGTFTGRRGIAGCNGGVSGGGGLGGGGTGGANGRDGPHGISGGCGNAWCRSSSSLAVPLLLFALLPVTLLPVAGAVQLLAVTLALRRY